jgi:hypothetical protein
MGYENSRKGQSPEKGWAKAGPDKKPVDLKLAQTPKTTALGARNNARSRSGGGPATARPSERQEMEPEYAGRVGSIESRLS